MKPLYYRRDGTPYKGDRATLDWGKDFSNWEIKRVADSKLKNGKRVSTVWLGLDHGYGEGKPLIFETMVFPKDGSFSELECERYSTEEDAKKGRERLVEKWEHDATEG